jgi:phosphatidylglycerol---prolipoprotein diacylglyceryl transferase
MLVYPNINPVAFHLGPLPVHWYGLMYLVGFVGGWLLLSYRAGKPDSGWKKSEIGDLVFYAALGVIIGGRIGYVVFYNFHEFIRAPWMIFKLWQGGMSFHGGFLGVWLSMALYARKLRKPFAAVVDFIIPVVPIGLAAGRLGNFINGELWGRMTNVSWGMVYPQAGTAPRHPSELYEFLLEGLILFTLLWWFSSKPRPPYAVTGFFVLGYSLARFFCEFFRQPDAQLGFVAWDWLTMGQLLSLPMMLLGIGFLVCAYRKR